MQHADILLLCAECQYRHIYIEKGNIKNLNSGIKYLNADSNEVFK